MEFFAYYILLGVGVGVLAGLLGVGGGLIIVPVLVWIFQQQGVSDGLIIHLAIGTSLATIVFTSISSVWAHHKKNAVLWRIFWQLTPGIVIGAWLGSILADELPSAPLKIFFGIFELLVALQMTFSMMPEQSRELPKKVGMTSVGGVIGIVSALVGIGGGTMTVPFLVWCKTNVKKAIATSAACGLPIAIAGMTGFMFVGQDEMNLPMSSIGYVYLPAWAGIAISSILFAPLGAIMAHAMDTKWLKKMFAVLLYILAFKMLFF